jgi:glycerol-3-phosphate acyltransferase PlsY
MRSARRCCRGAWPWPASVAVVGHNWSIFLRFGGGAGTGPNVGWSAAIWPWIFPIAFLVMGGMLYFVGMASVASLSMAAVTIIIFAIRYGWALTRRWPTSRAASSPGWSSPGPCAPTSAAC